MSGESLAPELLEVEEGEEGRLDAFVARRLDLSRTRVQALLAQGHVRVDGEVPKKSHGVTPGERVEIVLPEPKEIEARPEAIPLDVVYEDESLLVLNKAAGMVVHPAPGHRTGTLVNALLHHVRDLSGIGGRLRPGIVHRLDRDTSGLMLVAKNDEAHRGLSEALRRREIKRLYRAATWGHLPDSETTVDAPIGRDPRNRKRMAVVEGGRSASTRIRVRARWQAADDLEVALGTGRTHQIRVHLAHLGHPVVGDALYGAGWHRGIGGRSRAWARELHERVERQFLHAWRLAFTHPVSGETLRLEAPLPADLAAVAEWMESGEPES